MKLSIVIPIYNEARSLRQILRRIERVDFGEIAREVILVDDGSSDGTREIIRALGEPYVIHYHPRNRGKGAALRTGFAVATGDWVVVQDADLEYDPEDLRAMLQVMREN